MSLNDVEVKLKTLGMQNDTAALEAFVSSLEDEKICSLIACKICHSDAPQLLNYLYRGMPQNSATEMKRFKVTERVLKELQSRELQNKQVNAIVSRLVLEVEKLTPAQLVQFCEYCIHCIQHEDGERTSWKDLLPKLLSVLVANGSVNHAGIDMTGSEYKSEVIRTLLMVQWRPSIVTSLASFFTEVSLSSEHHLQAVNKLCASFEQLAPPEIPPLVHQLLQLCKNQHGIALFLRLQAYFCTRLYNRLLSTARDSESTSLAADGDSIGLASETEAQPSEATVLFHILQSARFGHASIRNFLKFTKNVTNAPELVLDPFLLTVLLSVSNISIYQEQVFDVLKCTMQRVVLEEERKVESAWLRDMMPSCCDVELVFTKLMANSLRERSSVMEGMVNLAFILLGAKAAKGKETVAEKLRRFGMFVLVRLTKKHNETTGPVLQRLTDSIITGQDVTQYTDCLHQMAMTVPVVFNEHRAIVITLLEMLTQLPGPVAENVVYAMLPIVHLFPSLRDVLIMVLRKALFARNVGTRKMAVSGFLQLLNHLDVKGMAVLSSSQSSHHSNSQGQPPARSILTQIDLETGNSSTNNEAICLELLGVLRRCFMQQAEVRLRLYEGVHSGVTRNPELRGFVQDMLINHFNQFYESDPDTLPPLNFTKAVALRDISAELQEPLGHLIFSIQQVANTDSCNGSPTKLINIFQSLCSRMLNCSLENFGLNEATDLFDVLPEGQQQQEIVRQILGVFEALMGYIISSWTKDTSAEKAQKLNSLFKGYSGLAEFLKNNHKVGKKGDGDAGGAPRAKKMDGNKQARAKGRTVTFRFPHTVLDYHVIHRMLCILHMNSVPWCTAEAANEMKGHRGFSMYVMETTLKLLKASQAENHSILKSTSRLNSYINIGSVVYSQCVAKLQEFVEFDAGTAALTLDCFNVLFGLICSHYEKKLGKFLGEVGTVPASEGLTKQLFALVSKHEELLTSVLSLEDEAEGEPAAKKIPLLLIQGIKQFTLRIPCNDACSKVLNWVKLFVKDKVLSNVNLMKGMLSLLFTLELRCKGSSQLYEHIAMQLSELMGTVNEDEEVEKHISYSAVRAGYENAVLFLLCDIVKRMLEYIDWTLLRLRAEYTAMTHFVGDGLQAKKESLKRKECDVVHQISQCVQILNYVSNLALKPGPATDAVLKLLTHQYTSLTTLTKYFILRSTKTNPAFHAVRFEMVVKLAGKFLSPHVYNLISHIEANQKEENGTKKKKADPLAMKSKVLRETRFIPNLIYEIEQYEKFIIELSKKSKVNLMSYVKLSTYRDFRINSNRLRPVDDQDQSNAGNDTVVSGVEPQENGHNISSVVKEPPRKKARKQ